MKPKNDDPYEPRMRFFRPELYLRFNSLDSAIANEANEQWECALERYDRHLAGVIANLPREVREFCSACYHDAELVAIDRGISPAAGTVLPTGAGQTLSLMLMLDRKPIGLQYTLADAVRDCAGPADWPFPKTPRIWLYDELDVLGKDKLGYVQRILFSDGSVLAIPFASVVQRPGGVTLPTNVEFGFVPRNEIPN